MKNLQQHGKNSSSYRTVPVVRLDSKAVRIPVELIDNIKLPRNKARVLRINMTKGSFCAWR